MNAQTYLDHLKQKNPGQGVVTVHQSKAIDELVKEKLNAGVAQLVAQLIRNQ